MMTDKKTRLNGKRSLSLLLAVLMLVSCVGITAFAEEPEPEVSQSVFPEDQVSAESDDEMLAEGTSVDVYSEQAVSENAASDPDIEEVGADSGEILEGSEESPVREETVTGTDSPSEEESLITEEETLVIEEEVFSEEELNVLEERNGTEEEETAEEIVEAEPVTYCEEEPKEDNDALFQAYFEDLLMPRPKLRRPVGASNLTDVDLTVYNFLSERIIPVAEQGGSTVFELSVLDFGTKLSWTKEELGGITIISDGKITQEAKDAVSELLFIGDTSLICSALLQDNPLGMYWYDKTTGLTVNKTYKLSARSSSISITSGTISYSFAVSPDYGTDYVVDSAEVSRAQTAAENARAIVATWAACPDNQKLTAYRDEICALASYNGAAASGGVPYGDPWQAIYVFDGDASTKVVCEGYSKAFEYLCDMSAFESGGVSCISVTGSMNGSSHMWNIVTLADGYNYLADITNSDGGATAKDNGLFLVGFSEGSVREGYVIVHGSTRTLYEYDGSTKALMTESELTLKAAGGSSIGCSYSVSFDKNASKATGTMRKQTGTVTAENTLTANAFRWTGHTFAGWNTEADGTGKVYDDKALLSQVISEDGQSLTLYAQWTAITYTVAYDANGGDVTPPAQVKEYGEAIALSTQMLTRPGYSFKGWAISKKDADAGRANYRPGAVCRENRDLMLYAAWSRERFEIIYDGNGVTGGASEAKVTVTFGQGFTMKNGGFTKAGFVLRGWSLDRHEAAVDYSFDYAVNKKMTDQECEDFIAEQGYSGPIRLYAVWSPSEYSITYKCVPASASKSLINENAASYNALEGIRFSAASAEGYDFVGFFSDSRCTNEISGFPAGTTGTKTVYLKFEPHQYTIRFSAESGTFRKPMPDLSCTVGTAVSLPACTVTPPTGYVFSGWEYDNGSTYVALRDRQRVTDLSLTEGAVVELKAVFRPITYSISLNANGGKFADGKTSMTVPASYDSEVVLPEADGMSVRENYTLVGWNGKSDCSGADHYDAGAAVINLVNRNNGKITLYAVWEYDVLLDGNGGTTEDDSDSKVLRLKYNNSYTPGDEGFTKAGDSFVGWATSAANAERGTVLRTLRNLKPGTTLYASWKADPAAIS